MTYKWKLPGIIPVDAQTAGEELERIFTERGRIDPKDIVDESRSASAPLHKCFEWDDAVAAEKYREVQAGDIIRAIVTTTEIAGKKEEIRAFVHVQDVYQPFSVAIQFEDRAQELLQTALKELVAIRRKYNNLSALVPVFEAIDAISA